MQTASQFQFWRLENEREIAYCAQTTFTDAEIAELISEVDDLTARLDLLQRAAAR